MKLYFLFQLSKFNGAVSTKLYNRVVLQNPLFRNMPGKCLYQEDCVLINKRTNQRMILRRFWDYATLPSALFFFFKPIQSMIALG